MQNNDDVQNEEDVQNISAVENAEGNTKMISQCENDDGDAKAFAHCKNDDGDAKTFAHSKKDDGDAKMFAHSNNDDGDAKTFAHSKNDDGDADTFAHSKNDDGKHETFAHYKNADGNADAFAHCDNADGKHETFAHCENAEHNTEKITHCETKVNIVGDAEQKTEKITHCETEVKIIRSAERGTDQIPEWDTTGKSQKILENAEGDAKLISECDTTEKSRTSSMTEGGEPQPRGEMQEACKTYGHARQECWSEGRARTITNDMVDEWKSIDSSDLKDREAVDETAVSFAREEAREEEEDSKGNGGGDATDYNEENDEEECEAEEAEQESKKRVAKKARTIASTVRVEVQEECVKETTEKKHVCGASTYQEGGAAADNNVSTSCDTRVKIVENAESNIEKITSCHTRVEIVGCSEQETETITRCDTNLKIVGCSEQETEQMTRCETSNKSKDIGENAEGVTETISQCDTTVKSQKIDRNAEGETEKISGCDTTDKSRTASMTKGEEPQPRGGILKKGIGGGDAAEGVEDNILSSARYFKREAAVNAENARIGSIYSSERKEREAVDKMSVSFAREEVREEDDAEETAGEDKIQYSKRIAETITKPTVIENKKNIDSEEDETKTEGFRESRPKEGRLRWDASEGKWMATSALDDWEASIESYMDATKPQTKQEEEWMRRKHKKKKSLLIIELEPERGRSGDTKVAYRKTEVNSYCDTTEKINGNDTRIGSEKAYRKTDTISDSDTMEEMDENETDEKTITKKKWVGPKAGHNCKEYSDQQESEGQTGHKKIDCKSTSSNEGTAGKGKGKGRCNHCNKPGYQEDTCWSKPGRAVRKKNKRKQNGKVEPRNETAKSRRREAVRSHSPFSLKRSSLRIT